jgi:hypothetical protein
MKKNALIAVGFSSALLFTVNSTLPATADTRDKIVRDGEVVARGKFISRGDTIIVNDKASDGYRAYVEYVLATGREDRCEDDDGADSPREVCPLRAREDVAIRWRLCILDADAGTRPICNPWKRDRT